MSELDSVRLGILAHHGLGSEAAKFLDGESIEELEASAERLAGLFAERSEPDPADDAPADVFAGARAAKVARQQALVNAVTGRSPQGRDAQGRFASSGFDGGAREPVQARRSPEAEHGQLIGQMAALSRTFRG